MCLVSGCQCGEDDEQVRFLEQPFQRVVLGKDDVVVLSMDGAVSDNAFKNLRRVVGDVFPNNKMILLEDGMTIGAVGKDVLEEALGDARA